MSKKLFKKAAFAFAAFLLTISPIAIVLRINWEVQQIAICQLGKSFESIDEFFAKGIRKHSSRRQVEEWLKQNKLVGSFTSIMNNEFQKSVPSPVELAGLDESELSGMVRVIWDEMASLDASGKGSINRVYIFFDKNDRYVGHLVHYA